MDAALRHERRQLALNILLKVSGAVARRSRLRNW